MKQEARHFSGVRFTFCETFMEIQDSYDACVCITEPIHKLFHKHYGHGDNTIEQWDDFVEKYRSNYYLKVS